MMIQRLPGWAAFVCLAVASSQGMAANQDVATLAIDIPHTSFVLPNGLTVVVHEDHKTPQVTVEINYHVGSANEPEGRSGFSHLFEHLMFNGTEHYNDEWFKGLQPLGATDVNGVAYFDRTNYFQTVPTASLDAVLWFESDRMGHLLGAIDQAKLDEQRGVVQNEKRVIENEPYGLAAQRIARATWPASHPYSHVTIGSMEDLRAASLEDVQAWFKAWYGPANAVLVLAGDITPAQAREKVTRYFSAIEPGVAANRVKTWIAPRSGSQRDVIHDSSAGVAMLRRIWNVPGEGAADADYLDLLGAVLSQSRSSRLKQRLIFDERIATEVSAGVKRYEVAGQFSINVTAAPGADMARIEQVVDEELTRLLREGPSLAELDAVRLPRTASMVRDIQSTSFKASVLSKSAVFLGDAGAWKNSFERLNVAQPADLTRAGRRWLSDGDYVLSMLPGGRLAATGSDVDRQQVPRPSAISPVMAPKFVRAELANGMQVLLCERHDAPEVTFNLMIPVGSTDAEAFPAGIAALTMDLSMEGAGTRNALEVAATLERLGSTLSARGDEDFVQISLSSLVPSLSPSLQLLADVLMKPSFNAADLQRLKALEIADLTRTKADSPRAAARLGNRLLFGPHHPYGRLSDEQSIEAITRADIVRFHQSRIRPNLATLVVVGDITLDQLMPKLEALLGRWQPGKNSVAVVPQMPKPDKATVWLIDAPGALQSNIQVLLPLPPHAAALDAPLELLNGAFGGIFMSRLNLNLREDKQWSYGVHSAYSRQRGVRVLRVRAPVQTDKTSEAMTELRRELLQVSSERPVSAQELLAVQQEQTLGLADLWETHQEVADALSELVIYPLPDDYLDGYAARINAVTPEDVRRAALEFIGSKPLTWVVAGDLARIEKKIRALNLGEVRVIDSSGEVVR
ncbi:M16 family metallopeptidase [Steroidobacter sp.]|uniref:M16 family metallopeptidase n=1 Tax=Steroidobacter sp. TaxID=1978227 RepID=UPI001A499609|nr:pitrilysin family protein [Steroidobacter sp.]MBL8269045.1 insulinase family protein [Steroidobacter sp.]